MRLLYLADSPTAGGELSESGLRELYRHPLPDGHRTWVRSNFVASLDGSTSGPDGRSGSINTSSDQHVFALHRAHADVILVGAQTVRSEGYGAVDLAPWQREVRAEHGLAPSPTLAIVSRSLDLDLQATDAARQVGPVLVLTTAGKSRDQLAPVAAAGADVVQLPGDAAVDLSAALEQLASAGLGRVLCEGGSRLHRDLLAAELLDELSLTLAPVVVGGAGSRTTTGDLLPRPASFHLRSAVHADDGAVFLSYLRREIERPL